MDVRHLSGQRRELHDLAVALQVGGSGGPFTRCRILAELRGHRARGECATERRHGEETGHGDGSFLVWRNGRSRAPRWEGSIFHAMDDAAKKTVLRHFPYGLYALTVRHDGEEHGMTANWV